MGIWEVSGSVWCWKLGRHEAPQCAERTLVFQSEGLQFYLRCFSETKGPATYQGAHMALDDGCP